MWRIVFQNSWHTCHPRPECLWYGWCNKKPPWLAFGTSFYVQFLAKRFKREIRIEAATPDTDIKFGYMNFQGRSGIWTFYSYYVNQEVEYELSRFGFLGSPHWSQTILRPKQRWRWLRWPTPIVGDMVWSPRPSSEGKSRGWLSIAGGFFWWNIWEHPQKITKVIPSSKWTCWPWTSPILSGNDS